jgi:hypothetical protein
MDILNIAFAEYNAYNNKIISLDEKIMTGVIRPRVLTDANIVGGIHTVVDLNKCQITYLNNREFIVDVPKSLTNGKSVITALSLVSNVIYSNTTAYSEMQAPLSSANNMMNNLGTENVVQTARLEMIGDNTILVQDPTIHLINSSMRCIVENMDNLENINPRSYVEFGKLCVLAAKAHIYNTTIIKLDKGYIYSGHELGIIKDLVDSYSDANELYMEHLKTVWGKVAFMNNSDSMDRYIKSMISNTI